MTTDVAFHFGAPDKLAYVCRLLRKATASGVRVMVVGAGETLQQLDTALWALAATDFVTHTYAEAPGTLAARSSVVLSGDASLDCSRLPVLVNLLEQAPLGFERFARVIEVVSTDEADRNLARERWKHYMRQGIAITRHDLALKA
ncbi:MAG: DNA polymerase III subunit chi [Burkholderiales bacterium]|nr:DNA polymerase III subunit chi [Burkholderiales bacterium]